MVKLFFMGQFMGGHKKRSAFATYYVKLAETMLKVQIKPLDQKLAQIHVYRTDGHFRKLTPTFIASTVSRDFEERQNKWQILF